MNGGWSRIVERVRQAGAVVRVSVIAVDGSAPRDAGSFMLVTRDTIEQTIGGGRLEYEAIGKARQLLQTHGEIGLLWRRETCVYPLGPALGQCCGGVARLLFEVLTCREIKTFAGTAGAGNPSAVLPSAVLSSAALSSALVPPALVIRPCASGRPPIIASDRKADYALPVHVARIVKDMLSGARPRLATFIKVHNGPDNRSYSRPNRQSHDGPDHQTDDGSNNPLNSRHDAWYIEPVGATRMPLYIYGAGHVGRAIVKALAPLQFDIRWVDIARDRFPQDMPLHAVPVITATPQDLAGQSAAGVFHLVLTFSHALDMAICQALLVRDDFAFLGLIGSETKRARFLRRLRDSGIPDAALARLISPIGLSNIRGKDPATIAVSVAAQLIETLELLQKQADNDQRRGTHGQGG